MRPTLFLDVDGVVSPFHEPPDTWGDWTRARGGGFCQLSRRMGDALAALPARRMWLTTWEEAANEIICPALGWEPLPVVDRRMVPENPWWKLNAIIRFLEVNGGPFIWVDDDIATEEHVHGSLANYARDIPHLVISPDTATGITPEMVDYMAKFLAELGDTESPSEAAG